MDHLASRDKLNLLIKIINDLSVVSGKKVLIRELLLNALEFTEAERGYFIQRKPEGGYIFFDGDGVMDDDPQVSFSTIEHVFQTGKPMSLIENSDGRSIPPTASILALNLKTIMCAPLIQDKSDNNVDAVLYVDSTMAGYPFTRQDLEFFGVLASHAAIIWNHINLTRRLEEDYRLLQEEVRLKFDYHRIVGQCRQMQEIYEILEMLRNTDLDVLIIGATGTGKELIAKAIHYSSARSGNPLKEINCAALPEGLVEAELFGVERNVATEVRSRTGKLEQANTGTLFLDEIGDMPIRVQNRLMRFLEERRFRRIGGREEVEADVRVLAATNRDLDKEVKAGRFRKALRYRLDVVTIRLPLLRDRGDDLKLLADFFLKEVVDSYGMNIQGFTAEAWQLMRNYPWPGNVRELKHRIQSAAFLAGSQLIDAADLGLKVKLTPDQIQPLKKQREHLEKYLIERTLKRHDNDLKRTATALKLSDSELLALSRKHAIPI